jgi:hypothetical protein
VFSVRYELSSYILIIRYSVFKGLIDQLTARLMLSLASAVILGTESHDHFTALTRCLI